MTTLFRRTNKKRLRQCSKRPPERIALAKLPVTTPLTASQLCRDSALLFSVLQRQGVAQVGSNADVFFSEQKGGNNSRTRIITPSKSAVHVRVCAL